MPEQRMWTHVRDERLVGASAVPAVCTKTNADEHNIPYRLTRPNTLYQVNGFTCHIFRYKPRDIVILFALIFATPKYLY